MRYQLAKILRELKPEVVHCHLRRSTRLMAKIKPEAAVVSTLHIGWNGPHFSQMDGIVCNARWQMEEAPTDYRGLLFKANNSLEPHNQLAAEETIRIRQSLGVAPDEMLFGAVGRYHESKAWDILIQAFKKLAPEKRVKLLFFGSGSLESDLKKMAADDNRIQFVGFRKDIKDLYQAFDIACCPSRFEPLPRVMLEAMDAGTPIVASDTGGCRELIEDYGGFMFPVDNIEALAALLNDVVTAKPVRHRPDLTQHYVWNANQAMVDFYQKVIAHKKSSRAA